MIARVSSSCARIHEREQVADRDRLDARGLQLARGLPHGVASRARAHVAGVVGALGDFPRQALRRDRRGLRVEIVEQIAVARLVLHLLHGAIALGDEQADLGAAHLQERVGGDGGAVREELDLGGRDAARDEARDAVETPSAGFFGVLETFSTVSSPLCASSSTRSVCVPPTSTPSRYFLVAIAWTLFPRLARAIRRGTRAPPGLGSYSGFFYSRRRPCAIA